MNILRDLERKLFPCPETDCSDYKTFPPAEEDEFMAMAAEYAEDPSVIHFFPFVRENGSGEAYIELYFWDSLLYPAACRRFLLADGRRMQERDEEAFLRYTKSEIGFSLTGMSFFTEAVDAVFPHWNVPDYTPQDLGLALEHMYFVSHRSGAREILYKAGLENIAYYIDRIPDVNIIGSAPEMIIGHDIPLRLLRILNKWDFVENLFDEGRTEFCREVYRKYSGFIEETEITPGQWIYLEELSCPGGLFQGEEFNRALYDRLAEPGSEYDLPVYRDYMNLCAEFPEIGRWKLPPGGETAKMKLLLDYHNDTGGFDERIRRRKENSAYEYSSEKYAAVMPGSSFEIALEAVMQGNCLMEYIKAHASGRTTILFVRKKECPEKSFVTVEIVNGKIQQAYGRYNEHPGEDVFRFLEEYARLKGISCDTEELMTDFRERGDWDWWEYEEEPEGG